MDGWTTRHSSTLDSTRWMSHHRTHAVSCSHRVVESSMLSTRYDAMRRQHQHQQRHQKANLQKTFASTPTMHDDAERRTIVFATTNAGKAARLREHLDAVGCVGVEIETLSEDAVETQRDTVRAVALDKARAATATVRRERFSGDFCVVAHDCGLVVRALNGFPGPYTKDFNFKVGGVGLLRLLTDEASDRAASWDETLVCVDGTTGEEFVFSREFVYDGEVAREMPKKWTRWGDAPERSVGSVFVPTAFGFREPLADVSEEDYQRFRRESPSVWNEFADFVASEGW